MEFGPNKTPIKIIQEGVFGGNYFRVIYSGINEKWYRKSWKEFDQLKSIIVQIIMMSVSVNMVLNSEHR